MNRGNLMSKNLNMLLQNHCRPVTVAGNPIYDLFPLERECEEGKTLLAKAPAKLLDVQEFDPSGLEQSYRDHVTGALLPVFAVFNLEGKERCTFDITTQMLPSTLEPTSLQAKLPLKDSQPFVKKLNERRMKLERTVNIIVSILGILPAAAYVPLRVTGAADTGPLIFLGGWLLGAMLVYIAALNVLERICPWKKLVITAEFNGILPRDVREKARAAKPHFDHLYLIVDQQYRWKSEILPDPAPRGLDPLLVGEVKQAGKSKYYLIHKFDLTVAEQYLADEFAAKLT
jgi:hypothetical protein